MVAPRFHQPDLPRIRCVIVELVPAVGRLSLERSAGDSLADLRAEADPQVAALVHRLARRVADEIRDEQGGWAERSELPPTRWGTEIELPEEFERGAWQASERPVRRPR